jgi:hypothetical protein
MNWYALPAQTQRVTGEVQFYSEDGWSLNGETRVRESFEVHKTNSGNVGYICLFGKYYDSDWGSAYVFLLSDDFTPYSGYLLTSVPDSYDLGRYYIGSFRKEDNDVETKFYEGCRYYLGLTPVEADININITYS